MLRQTKLGSNNDKYIIYYTFVEEKKPYLNRSLQLLLQEWYFFQLLLKVNYQITIWNTIQINTCHK